MGVIHRLLLVSLFIFPELLSAQRMSIRMRTYSRVDDGEYGEVECVSVKNTLVSEYIIVDKDVQAEITRRINNILGDNTRVDCQFAVFGTIWENATATNERVVCYGLVDIKVNDTCYYAKPSWLSDYITRMLDRELVIGPTLLDSLYNVWDIGRNIGNYFNDSNMNKMSRTIKSNHMVDSIHRFLFREGVLDSPQTEAWYCIFDGMFLLHHGTPDFMQKKQLPEECRHKYDVYISQAKNGLKGMLICSEDPGHRLWYYFEASYTSNSFHIDSYYKIERIYTGY